jgi:hypothetical protein
MRGAVNFNSIFELKTRTPSVPLPTAKKFSEYVIALADFVSLKKGLKTRDAAVGLSLLATFHSSRPFPDLTARNTNKKHVKMGKVEKAGGRGDFRGVNPHEEEAGREVERWTLLEDT